MKFYKRFPGDIMKKTSGLTMAQFGAYDRLIDWCYANEKPVDPDEVYTITHAQTPADRRDVDKVLAKFFVRDADGFRQERIEEVIAEALPKIAAARENGKKGGRPKKQTQEKPTGFSKETQGEPNAKTSHEPDSSIPSEQKKARNRAAPPPDGVSAQTWADWLDLRKKKRAPVTETVIDAAKAEAIKAGLTLDAFLRIWCFRGSQGLQADWLKPHELAQYAPAKSFRERDADARAARIDEMTGGLLRRAPAGNFIDMEIPDAPAITNG